MAATIYPVSTDARKVLEVLERRSGLASPQLANALIRKGMENEQVRVWSILRAIALHYICSENVSGYQLWDLTEAGKKYLAEVRKKEPQKDTKPHLRGPRQIPPVSREQTVKSAGKTNKGKKEQLRNIVLYYKAGGITVEVLEEKSGLNGDLRLYIREMTRENMVIVDPGKTPELDVITAIEYA